MSHHRCIGIRIWRKVNLCGNIQVGILDFLLNFFWHVCCILKSCMELSYMDPDVWIEFEDGVRRVKSKAVDCTYTSPRENSLALSSLAVSEHGTQL